MKLKKVLLGLITIAVTLGFVLAQGINYTVNAANELYAKNIRYMKTNPNYGYGVAKENAGVVPIWNIVECAGKTDSSYSTINSDIYCVKQGRTLANTTDATKPVTFDYSRNMKTEKSDIVSKFSSDTEFKIVFDNNENITIDSVSVNRYNAILAILDNSYVLLDTSSNGANKTKKRDELNYQIAKKIRQMVEAGSTEVSTDALDCIMDYSTNEVNPNKIGSYFSDEDIKATQQVAIWYFTEKPNTSFNMKNPYKTYDEEYSAIFNDNDNSESVIVRKASFIAYYEYLKEIAKNNASKYNSIQTGAPAKINTTTLGSQQSGSNTIIGPINITENANSFSPYTIDFTPKNGSTAITNYTFCNAQGQSLGTTDVKLLVGNDFYISIPTSSVGNSFNIDLAINYSNTTMKIWTLTGSTTSQQPLVKVERTPATPLAVNLSFNQPEKKFDLALRKYITKIGTTELTGDDSRVPNIDATKLNSTDTDGVTKITTASYKHRKNPVSVEKDTEVTYKLTVYNEGDKKGRATEITDQLPAGLTLSSTMGSTVTSSKGNVYTVTNDTTNNKIILRTTGTTNLNEYDGTNLDSDTIEIKCKVTATDTSRKILTNIAWISEEVDVDGTVITNQDGADRDSKPSEHPNKNKNELVTSEIGYTGKETKTEEQLKNSNYHFIGQEDDDDFEKLLYIPKEFDLKLVKFISAINGDTSKGKTVTAINTTNLANKSAKTADYTLSKEPIKVKAGDYVTYTFRVYNEGDINGYVTKLTDNIPLGLQFVQAKGDGQTITIYKYNSTDGLTSEDKVVDSATYNSINQNNSQWQIDKDAQNHAITDTYDGDTTPSVSINVSDLTSVYRKLNAYDSTADTNKDGRAGLDSLDVTLTYRVSEDADVTKTIRNEAAITGAKDEDNNEQDVSSLRDRDSQTKPVDSVTNPWPGKDDHEKYQDDEDYDNVVLESFDLALRKFIVAVSKDKTIENSEYLKKTDGSYERAPVVDTSKLNTKENNELITTATYNHPKAPVEVNVGDYVVYNLRVYNEGNVDGYATKITDYLPPNLEFVTEGDFNSGYGWSEVSGSNGRKFETSYLANTKIDATTVGTDGKIELATNEKGTAGKELLIMCRVKDTTPLESKLTNIAEITSHKDGNNNTNVTDRDSKPNSLTDEDSATGALPSDDDLPSYKDTEINRGDNYIPGQQDDDDFEKVIVKPKMDLALTKFIAAVSSDATIENGEYLTPNKNEGSKTNEYTRATVADTTGLKNGTSTNATYTPKKDIEPLVVNKGDYVLYNIRVYNEGEVDVFAGEVKDYLPENLEFVEGNAINNKFGWTASGRTVTTDYLSYTKNSQRAQGEEDRKLKAFDKQNDDNKGSGLDYRDLQILCRVKGGKKLINTAEITKYEDESGKEIPKDVDSTPKNKKDKNTENRSEDDDDYEVVTIQNIDIALTKFIIAISADEKIEDGEYLTKDKTSKDAGSATNPFDRQTKVDTTELKAGTKTDAVYTRVKDPLLVNKGAFVLYNIRVYNEGDEKMYAGKVTDYLPENLSFVDGEFNKKIGWTAQGQVVSTDYLSHGKNANKVLKAFDRTKDQNHGEGLDFQDLPILCQVNTNTPSNKELVNTAEITEYQDKDGKVIPKDEGDVDSQPENKKTKNDKNREQDDDDYEVVVVKEFDLALRKWVTQAIVTENGKQTVTNTGHQPYDNPEQVVKVELNRRKINNVTVKFKYSIRVINEGDIAGYAKEITDYVPQGLKFVAADNPGWTDAGNNVIKTRLLENKLLQPGEFADIPVLLTWENNENNMGVKTNIAEISEDYNEFGVPDKDSTPNNKKQGEDDIDDAPVMLSVSTGAVRTYFTIGLIVLVTLASGVVLIKKYVL